MVTTKDIKVLDMFMRAHNIPYVLTGTAALMVHGILPKGYAADDIDIIVLANKSEDSSKYISIEKTLSELELLSGEEKNAYYYNSVITFKVNGVKVNAFMGSKVIHRKEDGCIDNYTNNSGEKEHCCTMIIEDRYICVSDVICVLRAKFGLKRMKDYMFAKDLASTILNIGF